MVWDWLFGPNRLYYTSDESGASYIEWVTGGENGCVLATLNRSTGERTDYDLQGLCTYGIPLPSGDRLYYFVTREFEPGGTIGIPVSATLARMNPYTGERTDLLQGKSIHMMDVSEDGHDDFSRIG
ncbi:MAG: hypothetical protein U0694_09475 [Anaerolineae bacterium]